MARLLFFRGAPADGDAPLFVTRLRQTRTRIGRVDDCDVVLPDDAVSRSHCLIDQREGAYELIDRSSNGTWVDGARVQARSILADGARIRIGPFTAVVQLDPKAYTTPTEEPQPEQRDEEIVDAGEALSVAEAWLVVAAGPGEGRSFRLRGGRIGVGGFGTRGVVLPDPGVIRDHVWVRLYHGRTMIEPGEGAVHLGGHRVRDIVPVASGEEFRVGGTELVVEWRTRQDTPHADRFGEMVGTSEPIRRAFGLLRRMAGHHAPVLLIGESGTGKELAARAIHDASPRAGRPFVALNCGAITATLFESELFGHERGAFTGANERRDGAFQRADGGTIFLDEVGELPEEAQAKLLRTLESGEVRRVGGAEPSFPDVRVVAATNRNLAEQVQSGAFRADLYFRLAVLAVRLPALRERPEDIDVIAGAIARHLQGDVRITPDAMNVLRLHHWPGNARELRNVLTRAFVLGGPLIRPDAIVLNPLDTTALVVRPPLAGRGPLEDAERDVVLEALRKAGGNRTQAARMLGVARSTLLYKLKKWGAE